MPASFSMCEMLEAFSNTTFTANGIVRKSWPLGEYREVFVNGLSICKTTWRLKFLSLIFS